MATLYLLITLVGVSGVAQAAPGDHVRVGDLSIAPRIEAGFSYRTNVYRESVDVNGGGLLTLTPGVDLVASSDSHEFKLGGEWELRKYLAVEKDASKDLSASELDRIDNFRVQLGIKAFKDRMVGVDLDNLTSLRSTTADIDYSDAPFTIQFRDEVEGGLRLTPSSALQVLVHGRYSYDDYRVPSLDEGFESFNQRNAYGPVASARYLFLPRTAWVTNAEAIWFDWRDNAPALDVGGTTTTTGGGTVAPTDGLTKPDSTQVKVRTGLDGQVTDKVFVNLLAGYGFVGFDAGTVSTFGGLDGLLLNGQVRYAVTENNSVSVGYRRDFMDSWAADFLRYDYVYAQYAGKVADFRPSLSYGVRFEEYGDEGGAARSDIVNRLAGGTDYLMADWATLSVGASWSQRASDAVDLSYDDVEAHLLAKFVY